VNWSAQLFNYCERGIDPSFWAEPLNALSNFAFLIAAAAAGMRLAKLNYLERPIAQWILIILVAVIGVGSFSFHSAATRLAQLADVVPIGVFMLAYMVFALRQFLGLSWGRVGLGLIGFVLACAAAASIECGSGNAPCLNGSLAYLPALFGLLGIGAVVQRLPEQSSTGTLLLVSGSVFAISLGLRTIDMSQCSAFQILGYTSGTHFVWHLLNAFMLYLLLRAAMQPKTANPK